MTTGKPNPAVDEYILSAERWQAETAALRKILLDCGLTEQIKWGKPCYAYNGKNIAIIQGFKAYFALMFFKGYLLKDPEGVLVKMGENTKTGRQIRFADTAQIVRMEATIKAYVREAIEAEQQ